MKLAIRDALAWAGEVLVRGFELFWFTLNIATGIAVGAAAFFPVGKFAWGVFKRWAAQ